MAQSAVFVRAFAGEIFAAKDLARTAGFGIHSVNTRVYTLLITPCSGYSVQASSNYEWKLHRGEFHSLINWQNATLVDLHAVYCMKP